MTFVSEQTIEAAIEELQRGDHPAEQALQQLQAEQPVVMGWLFSPNFELFTRAEHEYLLYLVLVLYSAVKKARSVVPQPDAEDLSLAEESNWQLLGGSKSKVFHERLDPFFEQAQQEDLLAFAEDALSDYEDDFTTKEGREALFVALKSLIDCWTATP